MSQEATISKKNKSSGIKSWPQSDRPREKFLKIGSKILSNSELLAILLRTGTKGISAIDLGRNIIIPKSQPIILKQRLVDGENCYGVHLRENC